MLKIAVASQNRREITGHTGRCRKFWLYQVNEGVILEKKLLEMEKNQSFHETSPQQPSALDHIHVLISAGMGTGLLRRLQENNVEALITNEKDPDKAVSDYINGSLKTLPPEPHEHGQKHR